MPDEERMAKNDQVLPPYRRLDYEFRRLLKLAMKQSGKSRVQVAQEMTARLQRQITKRNLDDWVGPRRRDARIPAVVLGVFCEVTGNFEPVRLLMSEEGREREDAGRALGQLREEAQKLFARIDTKTGRVKKSRH